MIIYIVNSKRILLFVITYDTKKVVRQESRKDVDPGEEWGSRFMSSLIFFTSCTSNQSVPANFILAGFCPKCGGGAHG